MKIQENSYTQKIIVSFLTFEDAKVKPKTINFKIETKNLGSIQGLSVKQWFESILQDVLVLETKYLDKENDESFKSLFKNLMFVEKLDIDYICDRFFKGLSNYLEITSLSYE